MDIRKLQRAIVDGLEDVKAQNIAVFNTEHLTPLFERVVVASGTSNRQTRALAASVRDAVKGMGLPPPRTEGEVNGEWIIVDCGAAVVHVMQPSIRDYYHLEELWGEKPVKMKLGVAPAAKTGVKKNLATKATAKTATKAAEKTSPKKADVTQGVARTSAPRTATPARGAAAGKSTAAKKAAVKKTAARQAGVTRTVGVKSGAARKATTRARPAGTASGGKMPVRKTAARKTPPQR